MGDDRYQMQRTVQAATGCAISTETFRNRLRRCGVYAWRAMVCVSLILRHSLAHRHWANEHQDWSRS